MKKIHGHETQILIFFSKRLFGTVKLTKNAEPDKYKYSCYGMGFHSCSEFPLADGGMVKNVIIFGVDISLSVHINNKKKDILFFGEGPT